MSNKVLLNQIGALIDTKLEPVKKQLDTVEIKVEVVNKRLEQTEQKLETAIVKSQKETIEAVSDLVHTAYDLHDKRIRKIENHLHLS